MSRSKKRKLDLRSKIRNLRGRQSKTLTALQDFIRVESTDIDPEVTDPIDRTIYRTRVRAQRVFDGIQRRRDVGKQALRDGIVRSITSARVFLLEKTLGGGPKTKHKTRRKKRRVVK